MSGGERGWRGGESEWKFQRGEVVKEREAGMLGGRTLLDILGCVMCAKQVGMLMLCWQLSTYVCSFCKVNMSPMMYVCH